MIISPRKKTTLKEKDQLNRATGGAVIDNKTYNDLGSFSQKKLAIEKLFSDMDSQQFCARFKWKGVPSYLRMWRTEQMNYNRGSVAFFKVANRFYFMPYAMSGGLSPTGLPTEIIPITYNGSILKDGEKGTPFGKPLKVAFEGTIDKDHASDYALILYDRINGLTDSTGTIPRFALIKPIIEELADRFKYLKINLRNSQGKLLILVKDVKQAEAVRRAINNMYENEENFELVNSMYDVQVINNDINFIGQELWEDISSFDNLRLESLGYSNSGMFNKKERTIEKEISSTGSSSQALLMNAFESRKLFVEQAKELFGADPDFQRDFKGFDVELSEFEMPTKQEAPADEETEEEKGEDENV